MSNQQPFIVNEGSNASWRGIVILAGILVPILFITLGKEGDGIANCQDLQNMNLEGKYTLRRNIDCSDSVNWNEGHGFRPIGSYDFPFIGEFDGHGYRIAGLIIDTPTLQFCGLFGATRRATVKNVFLDNVDVTCDAHTGALIGIDYDESSISNSHVTGIIRGSDRTGGLIGYAHASTVEGCSTVVNVTGDQSVGGLIGETYQTFSPQDVISRCYSHGFVSGVDEVGGLVGHNSHDIRYSFSDAVVSGEYQVGGLVGLHLAREICDCYAKGTVRGSSTVGGFVGEVAVSDDGVFTSYSVGLVVTGGGFCGDGYPVTNCYWDMETSGRYTSGGGTGKTTPEMHTPSTYVGWDTNIWNIVPGEYPTLVEVPETKSRQTNDK